MEGWKTPPFIFVGKPKIAGIHEASSKIEYASWNMAPQRSGPLWSMPFCSGLASTIDESASDLVLHNYPTEGIKGLQWDGTEFCWSKSEATEHYGAIHFHDDDVYDFGWTSNMQWTVPSGIPSPTRQGCPWRKPNEPIWSSFNVRAVPRSS